MHRHLRRWFAVLTIGLCVPLAAAWQPGPPRDGRGDGFGPPGREHQRGPRDERPGRPERRGPDHPMALAVPIGQMFPPQEADRAPLREGEAEELLDFAREVMPDLTRMLERVKRRSPELFHKRLEEAAPRLRHLQRIFAADEQLGRRLVQHALNQRVIQEGTRLWRRADLSPERRTNLREELRHRVAENLETEVAVLRRYIGFLEENFDEQIDTRMRWLLAEGADFDLARVPPELREMIGRVREAPDEELRAAARRELRTHLADFGRNRIRALRQRLDFMADSPEREVDQRLERLLERPRGPGRGPHPPGAEPPPFDERRGDEGPRED